MSKADEDLAVQLSEYIRLLGDVDELDEATLRTTNDELSDLFNVDSGIDLGPNATEDDFDTFRGLLDAIREEPEEYLMASTGSRGSDARSSKARSTGDRSSGARSVAFEDVGDDVGDDFGGDFGDELKIVEELKKSEAEMCDLSDFKNLKGCSGDLACDLDTKKCVKETKVIIDGYRLAGSDALIQKWKDELALHKKSLIIRRDGDKEIIVPPCGLIPGQEDKYKGCPPGKYCRLDDNKCVDAPAPGMTEATVNGYKVFGSLAAIQNFIGKVQARAAENGSNPSIEFSGGSMGRGSGGGYTRPMLQAMTVVKLKDLAAEKGIAVPSKHKRKDDIIDFLLDKLQGAPAPVIVVPVKEETKSFSTEDLDRMFVKRWGLLADQSKVDGGMEYEDLDSIDRNDPTGEFERVWVDWVKLGRPVDVKDLNESLDNTILNMVGGPWIGTSVSTALYTRPMLEAMTVVKLKDLAKEQGIVIPGKAKRKDDIIDELLKQKISKKEALPYTSEEKIIEVVIPKEPEEKKVVVPAIVSVSAAVYGRAELAALTIPKLKDLAKSKSIVIPSKVTKKDDIISFLMDKRIARESPTVPTVIKEIVTPPVVTPPIVPPIIPTIVTPTVVPPSEEDKVFIVEEGDRYTEDELNALTVVKLKAIATEYDIKIKSSMRKPDIIAELLAHQVRKGGPSAVEEKKVSEKRVIIEMPPSIEKKVSARRLPEEEKKEEVISRPEKPLLSAVEKATAEAKRKEIEEIRARIAKCAGLIA